MRSAVVFMCLLFACTTPTPKSERSREDVVYKDVITSVWSEKKMFSTEFFVLSNGRVGEIKGPGKFFVAAGDTVVTVKYFESDGSAWFGISKHQKTGEDIFWR